jgi:ParB family chromosome partitioning protein
VFDEAALGELKESLRASGLLQPVVVRAATGGYELIAGERRWRAAEQLGWREIAAVIKVVDDRTLLALALVENLQRDQLSALDEAQGYARLVGEFGASQAEISAMVGRSRSVVANALRLLKLPEHVQQLMQAGRLTTGHGLALLQLDDAATITKLANRAVEQDLSVRELEASARDGRAPARRPRRRDAKRPNPEVQRVEDALRRRLKTDVFVALRGRGGRININFYSNDDLARVLELVLGKPYDG